MLLFQKKTHQGAKNSQLLTSKSQLFSIFVASFSLSVCRETVKTFKH